MPSISRVAAVILSALGIALAVAPAVADENRAPGLKEYEGSLSKISIGDDPPNPQFWFNAGLLTGLHWAKEEYAKAKATPLSAQTENTLGVYRRTLTQGSNGEVALSVYLQGFLLSAGAMDFASTDGFKRGKRLFCPGNRTLPLRELMTAVAHHVETLPKSANDWETPFALIVLEMLRRNYRCS